MNAGLGYYLVTEAMTRNETPGSATSSGPQAGRSLLVTAVLSVLLVALVAVL